MTFHDFFTKATGFPPFPYQEALAQADLSHLALAAPTGAGKTAAAVLAWLWQRRNKAENSPTRLVLCEPQRTLVEQVTNEVHKWLTNLNLLNEVSVHAMQGGYVDEKWELHPEKSAVIIGTQDQLLSRALNRGYAMSRFRWPVHFGLFNNDVQWVFDEIQLMGPGLITSAQLHGLRKKLGHLGPANTLWMSATLNPEWLNTIDHPVNDAQPLIVQPFSAADKAVEVMAARLHASKPLHKLPLVLSNPTKDETSAYINALADQVHNLHQKGGFTLVILNTVDRARALYEKLAKDLGADAERLHLLHSRFRPDDRQEVLQRVLKDEGDRIVISTQVVEAGVDISADILITELAPRSSMIQRFGRCNRKGHQQNAEVHWVELEEKAAAPYLPEDLASSKASFETMSSVEPAQFPDRVDEAWPIFDTLRRKDLLELFDTTSDLSGLDIDVGRFIRDGDDRDLFVFWREWTTERPPLDLPAPKHGELCKVSFLQAISLVQSDKLTLWLLDDLEELKGKWRKARRSDVVPGRTFLIACADGHYDSKTGWNIKAKGPVKDLVDEAAQSPFPAMADDGRSASPEIQKFLTLWQHTDHVCRELDILLPDLAPLRPRPDLQQALKTTALWHDVGKAYHVFQETMRRGHLDLPADVFYAKRIGSAFHLRRYFRHELASALSALHHNIDFLVVYLVACHHGKARVSVRAFPEEENGAILGLIHGEELPALEFPSLRIKAATVDLDIFRLGRGSWQERVLDLREAHGPFVLAYLESAIRTADVRASINEKKEGYYED